MSLPCQSTLFDRQAVLDRMLGDVELLVEVVEIFRGTSPARMQEIRAAVTNGDGEQLERSAHALKSSVGNFSANRAVDAAFQLEALGRARRPHDAHDALEVLEQEMDQLQSALDEMLGSLTGRT
ncbi:MAG: Hpt domain-containing protein [Planctomycetaceae bacterium]